MLFNSLEFIVFLPIVFCLYWLVFQRNLTVQNLLLLVASYLFYGWWDVRFLGLLFISSMVDYVVGLKIHATDDERRRKWWLWASVVVNLGILGFFKYSNFFVDSFIAAFAGIGIELEARTWNIILPVGISFYTFQALSYSIDIYRRQLTPTRDVVAYLTFVAFFPQLVAGPIERAAHLLPQFYQARVFRYEDAADGVRRILWGFFKKMVVADNLATNVNYIFDNCEAMPASVLCLGAVLFAFQIYCDFSGYSEIAVGCAAFFGFKLMDNFRMPYFSRDVGEFWKRWHISLSTWFQDYVYIPLGGNKGGKIQQMRNSIITFSISGFWHGANWTYLFWGFLNGLYYLPLIIFGRTKRSDVVAQNTWLLPSLREAMAMLSTFVLICFTWIFFRAESMTQAWAYIGNLFSMSLFSNPLAAIDGLERTVYLWLILLVCIEWLRRKEKHVLDIQPLPTWARWSIYMLLCLCIVHFGYAGASQFIYFQF